MLRKTSSIAIAITLTLAAVSPTSSVSARSALDNTNTSKQKAYTCFSIPYTPWTLCF